MSHPFLAVLNSKLPVTLASSRCILRIGATEIWHLAFKVFHGRSQWWQGVEKRQRGRQRGRPVKYRGDPDTPGLDPEQRRQLLQRISNRESARRTRKRQEEQLASMCAKVGMLCFPPMLLTILPSQAVSSELQPKLAPTKAPAHQLTPVSMSYLQARGEAAHQHACQGMRLAPPANFHDVHSESCSNQSASTQGCSNTIRELFSHGGHQPEPGACPCLATCCFVSVMCHSCRSTSSRRCQISLGLLSTVFYRQRSSTSAPVSPKLHAC